MASDGTLGPLFVVGMWRSGTSLLYALLNQHPQIALMYEGELPVLWPLFWIPGRRSGWAASWDFWNSALRRHRIDLTLIPSGISHLRAASEAVYKQYASRKGARIWGDKSPNYYDCLTRLARQFPNCRFIIIWRNPASTCRSVIRAGKEDPWFAKRGMTHRALLGCKRLKTECDRLLARGVPVHQITYEELTRDTSEVMMGVCQFLGISFDARMASLDGADRSAVYEGEHHALVKSEYVVASTAAAEVLSPELKSKIERYVSLWREEYGGQWPAFPPETKGDAGKPSFSERLLDGALYRCLKGFDFAVRLAYSVAPLWLWRAYRGLKRQPASSSS